jgi:RNA polymerase sigma-70 factor, ECF subfamily
MPMDASRQTDAELLVAGDPDSFEVFYRRWVRPLLAFFARRTGDPELAADLTAETFAAALAARERYRPAAGAGSAWLFGIAANKLAFAQRRGYAERRARRRLGMERIELDDENLARIESLGDAVVASVLVERLAPEQRHAIAAHVVEERGYDDIADQLQTSEAVVRKRVSRGLAVVRRHMGAQR